MSFADVRKLVAILNDLGFPRALSMESFRYPNFELVADCLHWLLLRYDPTIELNLDISTDGCRIAFLKQATQIMLSRARIKLNPRPLYSANGHAVKELLKVASVLQKATNTATKCEHEPIELCSSIKAFDVKATRLLVHEIAKHGASLCDILDLEPMMEESRAQATMMNMDMDEIEQGLREAINTMLENISSAEEDQEIVTKDRGVLKTKLDKRQLELERSEERLTSLLNVRPPYMDKYEALQKDLQELFVVYSKKSRNLHWLQLQMKRHNEEEQEMLEEINHRMHKVQRQQYEEELSILRGEEMSGSKTNLGNSGESDGEGTMFWKWFDGNSFKTIMDPSTKSHHQLTQSSILQSSLGLPKTPMQQWMGQTKGGLKALANPMLNPEFNSSSSTKTNIKDAFQVDESFKPRTSDSEFSTIDSDISRVLEEADNELLEMNDTELKNTGEDNSSDDDF